MSVFNLLSSDGRLLAMRGAILTLVQIPSMANAGIELLTLADTENLSGRGAASLIKSPAAKDALSRAWLITGRTPGMVGILQDDAMLTVAADGQLTFAAFEFGPAAQFRLVEAAEAPPKIWLKTLGNLGNRALLYLVGEKFRQLIPGAALQNIALPEWDLASPTPEPAGPTVVHTGGWDRFWIDVDGIVDCLRRGVMDTLIIDSFCFRIDHFPSRVDCRNLLGDMPGDAAATGFGANELVCSVRAGDILRGKHPGYYPLPPGYYRDLAERSGLDLVFFGQLGNDPYSQGLRAAFPDARFVTGRNPAHDFATLRKSRNLALSISTFAWLAGWLSEAACIYLPVGGIFNPVLHGNQMLLPLDEPEFHYTLLPYTKPENLFAAPEKFAAQQAIIEAGMRPVSAGDLAQLCARADQIKPRQPYVGGFDPLFYATQTQLGAEQNPLDYYIRQGFREKGLPALLDERAYLRAHPDAAIAIAEGAYLSPLHHYLAEGWRGDEARSGTPAI